MKQIIFLLSVILLLSCNNTIEEQQIDDSTMPAASNYMFGYLADTAMIWDPLEKKFMPFISGELLLVTCDVQGHDLRPVAYGSEPRILKTLVGYKHEGLVFRLSDVYVDQKTNKISKNGPGNHFSKLFVFKKYLQVDYQEVVDVKTIKCLP